MKLLLPFPPSANRYWRIGPKGLYVSDQARAYKAIVRSMARETERLEGEVTVFAKLHRPAKRGDLDNSLKVLFDALNGVAWVDDSQVAVIWAVRAEDKANPRVEVEVSRLDEAGPGCPVCGGG